MTDHLTGYTVKTVANNTDVWDVHVAYGKLLGFTIYSSYFLLFEGSAVLDKRNLFTSPRKTCQARSQMEARKPGTQHHMGETLTLLHVHNKIRYLFWWASCVNPWGPTFFS